MPVPHIVDGDVDQLKATLVSLRDLEPRFVVQGHGNVLLRGEVDEAISTSVEYLSTIVERVGEIVRRGDPPSALRDIDIESCGKSRIPLDGLVSKLHLGNLLAVFKRLSAEADLSV